RTDLSVRISAPRAGGRMEAQRHRRHRQPRLPGGRRDADTQWVSRATVDRSGRGWVSFAEKTFDAFCLQYTCRRMEDSDGTLRKCIFSVPPLIPTRIAFRVDHLTGIVTVALVN